MRKKYKKRLCRSFLLAECRLTQFSTSKMPTSAHFSTSFPHFMDNFSTSSCLFHQKPTSFPPIFCDFSTFYPHCADFSTGFPQVIHICDGLVGACAFGGPTAGIIERAAPFQLCRRFRQFFTSLQRAGSAVHFPKNTLRRRCRRRSTGAYLYFPFYYNIIFLKNQPRSAFTWHATSFSTAVVSKF